MHHASFAAAAVPRRYSPPASATTVPADASPLPPRHPAVDLESLAGWLAERGEPAFRMRQIRHRVFHSSIDNWDQATELPRTLRSDLQRHWPLFPNPVAAHRVARDRTEKLLLTLSDGEHIECVLMRERRRRTVCISTQVGCAMGCVFCASGLLGVKRNLTAAEVIEQVLRLDRLLPADERITNVVVMGIGEPLANLANLQRVLDVLTSSEGYGLSPRRITVSTVGLPDAIRRFGDLGKPFNLAVSLHAPNDELRNRLVPVNRNIGIAAVLAAADDYFRRTGRRVTYEYVLIGGLNDAPSHARQLAALLRPRCAHVNLIPMNPVAVLPYHEPAPPRTRRFQEILLQHDIAATVRKRKGADIDAACGQLRLQVRTAPPFSDTADTPTTPSATP
ncbi:MAG: 23S rRNA (adenine(2503)-C(2))-methyltransferase RlmN [Planctomycetota bacterium]|nr:MAG: 23S rRNA (adenine(2503)-C(2))-methyltransferase RlmN [Planctomycetota bacterium]